MGYSIHLMGLGHCSCFVLIFNVTDYILVTLQGLALFSSHDFPLNREMGHETTTVPFASATGNT